MRFRVTAKYLLSDKLKTTDKIRRLFSKTSFTWAILDLRTAIDI